MPAHPVSALSYEDRVLIEDLLARYSRAFDHRDTDAFLALFTDDGVFDSEMTGTFRGKQELLNFFTDLHDDTRFETRRNGQHWISNKIFTAVESDRVEVWSTFLFMVAPRGTVEVTVFGEYDDVLVKQNREWLFALRRIKIHADSENPDGSNDYLLVREGDS
jgi:uncharacterized protein (TIGR02246 family)